MHLTRFGFNVIVAIYLAPLVAIDLIGNTLSEGAQSDYYYYKFMLDALLLAYAVFQMFRGKTASLGVAKARVADSRDTEVANFEKLGAVEYLYCILLSAYAAVNWWFLHDINKHSTGSLSMASLIWSFLSIAVCVLAFYQFYQLKSGAIVELKKQILQ